MDAGCSRQPCLAGQGQINALRQVVVPSGATGASHYGYGLTADQVDDGYLTPAALDEART